MMALAIASALWITRALAASDHVERSHVAAFPSRPMRTLNLGPALLPSPGTLRLVLCPADNAPALARDGSWLVLSRDGRPVAREELTQDDARGRRCLEATAHASGVVTVTAELSASVATRVAVAERFTHRRFTLLFALPTIAFVLGLALTLFRRPRAASAASPDAYATPEAPTSWPWSWALALGAYVAVQLVNAMFVVGWMALYRPPAGVDGLTVAVTTITQHGLMVLVSFALLGAFQSDGRRGLSADWREKIGFSTITLKGAALSLLAAAGLVAIAIGSTKLIPDLNSSPMGRLLERSPARFAIAFGALIAPFSEELFFRAVLVKTFGRANLWRGALASAVVFTLVHAAQLSGAWAGLIPICAVGATNAAIYAKTRGLAYPWLVHTLYNGALTASLYFV